MSNTRFAVAVHVLTVISLDETQPISSQLIASSVGTNAALIRRLLISLNDAKITCAERGASGGVRLARPASSITLFDVWRAVDEEGQLFRVHPTSNPQCPVGRNIEGLLGGVLSSTQSTVEAVLGKVTIRDLVAKVEIAG
ncbi:Putative HTH-type transcriptional regulator YwnA [Zhongshania aliphaticivorans]|jgi:Rrf2 family protein|uniref:HTH-type transcriptional regulator YwnA n=1 Tax=Zhongshania aliphaticivorans TaxID=1470434 RepID=A0A5S9PSB2_9GAMM|nr:Rrf2 family transcriptional regulator [Zhongshania aliphaticivorans]CAA0106926.1 Putative HTH-type transcriptional regulator YwnA [Zhongshania aliphaticivorans]CAA0107043.1 Putative HTH-type transcriptional regulator YwnA [Zhongshania aliphaticivorans]